MQAYQTPPPKQSGKRSAERFDPAEPDGHRLRLSPLSQLNLHITQHIRQAMQVNDGLEIDRLNAWSYGHGLDLAFARNDHQDAHCLIHSQGPMITLSGTLLNAKAHGSERVVQIICAKITDAVVASCAQQHAQGLVSLPELSHLNPDELELLLLARCALFHGVTPPSDSLPADPWPCLLVYPGNLTQEDALDFARAIAQSSPLYAPATPPKES